MTRHPENSDPLGDNLAHLYRRFQDAYVSAQRNMENSLLVSVVSHGHVLQKDCTWKEGLAPWKHWTLHGSTMECIDFSQTMGMVIMKGKDNPHSAPAVSELCNLQAFLPDGARLLLLRPCEQHQRDILVIEWRDPVLNAR